VDVQQQQFHTILVVNDRLQLDRQLGDTVNALLTANGHPRHAVARANSTQQLKQYLSAPIGSRSRPRVVLTTVQKLSSLYRGGGVGLLRGAARRQEATTAAAAAAAAAADGTGAGSDGVEGGGAENGPSTAAAGAAAAVGQAANARNSSPSAGPKRQTQLTSFYSSSSGGGGGEQQGTSSSTPVSAQPHKELSQRSGGPQGQQLGPGLTLGAAQQQAAADRLGFAAAGRVAVIADEAHRYHGSGSAEQIHALLMGVTSNGVTSGTGGTKGSNRRGTKASGNPAAHGSKHQQQQQQGQGSTQQPKFLTYFGFTATPSARALQLFGVKQAVQLDEFGEVRALLPDPQDVQKQQQQQQQQQVQLGGFKQPNVAASSSKPPPAPPPPAAAAAAGGEGGGPGEEAPDDTKVAHLYSPFHAYTLQQAIQDGHVLDVLQNFISITPRLHISGAALQQQQQQQRQAAASAAGAAAPDGGPSLAEELLVEAASSCRQLVAAKAAAVVGKFLEGWQAALQGWGFQQYRGMVVVRSRQHVVWYVQEIRRLLLQQQTLLQHLLELSGEQSNAQAVAAGSTVDLVYGAFSGTVEVSAADADALAAHQQQLARCRGRLHAFYGASQGGAAVAAAAADGGSPGDKAGDAGDADDMEVDEEDSDMRQPSSKRQQQQQKQKKQGRGKGKGKGNPTRRVPPKAASFSNRSGPGTKAAPSAWDLALAHLEPDSDQPSGAELAGAAGRQQLAPCTTAAAECVAPGPAAAAGGTGVGRKRQRRLQEPTEDDVVVARGDIGPFQTAGSTGGSDSGACPGSDEKAQRQGSSGSEQQSESGSEGSWQQSASEIESESESEGAASDEFEEREECEEGDGNSSSDSGSDVDHVPSGEPADAAVSQPRRQKGSSSPRGLPRAAAASKRARSSVSCSSSLFGAGSESGAAAAAVSSSSGQPGAEVVTPPSSAAMTATAGQQAGVNHLVKHEVDHHQQQEQGQRGEGRPQKLRRLVRNLSRLSNTSSTTAAAAATTATQQQQQQQQQQSAPAATPPPLPAAKDAGTDAACIKQEQPQQEQQPQQQEQWADADVTGPAAAGAAVSEVDLNGRGAHHGAARLLVVCSKFETGYDDPRLAALFVDRPLAGAGRGGGGGGGGKTGG
jgi:hypothetical protein